MRHDQATPLRIDLVGVSESKHGTLDAGKNSIRLRRREAEAVVFEWSCANRPHLDQILRSDADSILFLAESGDRVACRAVLRMVAMERTKDNVRVDENVHYRFQSSSRV